MYHTHLTSIRQNPSKTDLYLLLKKITWRRGCRRKTKILKPNMSPNTSSDSATPSLEASNHHHSEEEETNRGCCKNVLDVEEAKTQLLFSLPMLLTNVFSYLITLISAMFAGHFGELELAGATLANSWAAVTGLAVMVTLSIMFMSFISFIYLVFLQQRFYNFYLFIKILFTKGG